MHFSTGLLTRVLEAGLRTAFTSPVLELRTGEAPASPDAARQGSLVCSISLPATGYFAVAANGAVTLAGTWSGTVQSAGTPGWFRIANGSDTGVLSSTARRIDGTVGTAGTDIVLGSATLAVGDTVTITEFPIALGAGQVIAAGSGTFV